MDFREEPFVFHVHPEIDMTMSGTNASICDNILLWTNGMEVRGRGPGYNCMVTIGSSPSPGETSSALGFPHYNGALISMD